MKRVHSSLSFLWESKIDITAAVSVFVWGTFLGLFCSSFALFFIVLSSDADADVVKAAIEFFDVGRKYEVLNFLGICMSGLLVGLYAFISYRRVKAMEDTVENAEKGRLQERLKNAIEHLGHGSVSIRLGGAYELFHLAQDTKELRQTVLDILCAHIRQTTSDKKYQEDHKSKPSEEIQSLLNLLFVQEHYVFKDLHINLQESWLNGANLIRAKLEKANLSRAYLQYAILNEAKLLGANLEFAYLQNAHFTRAQMQEACLLFAHLQGACIVARMQGAVLRSAHLQGALLGQAYLQGSDLTWAEMQGADLSGAHIEGANLGNAHLEGTFLGQVHMQAANLDGTNFRGATCLDRENLTQFTDHIRSLTGEQSGLSEVVFAGGLTQERVDSLVADLPGNVVTRLRVKLNPHIGRPASHVLPQDSGAITGTYTKEEAEQWVAEYKEAMSDVPGEGDS